MVRRLGALAFVVSASVSAVGCAAEPAEEGTEESADRLLAGRKVPPAEVASLLRQAGFPEAVVGKMVCTAKYESSYFERASNKNRNGSSDYGLFQINSIHIGGTAGCPNSASALYDAATNTRCALAIYKMQGINAWYGYKKHKAECDGTAAPAGGANPPQGAANGGGAGGDDGGCYSATLDDMVPALTCVQSKSSGVWMQCMDGKWYRGVSGDDGPYGQCKSMHPL